jgi:hypothetical protein
MIQVEINGATVVEIDFTERMTATDLQQKIADHQAGRHYRFNSFTLYDPSQNRPVNPTDEIVDDRRYTCLLWVQSIVDDHGEPLRPFNDRF